MRVLRENFTELYVDAVRALQSGANYAALDRLICEAISERGIPLDSLEWIGFGVPMPAYGVDLDDPDFCTSHPDAVPVLECFGISAEPNPYRIDVPDCAYIAGQVIANDLATHTDQRYRQVGWLMAWLWSCSGNSSVDLDYESHCELQPLSWHPDDVAFGIEIIREAEQIMADALAGLAFIDRHPDVLTALQANVTRIYKALTRQQGKRTLPKVKLVWPWSPTRHVA